MKIITYLHTHWDREWYRTFEEFRFRFFEVFEDIVQKLEGDEFPQFYLDGQTVLIDDLLEIAPYKKPLIKNLIKNKKIVIGPWYTLADEFLVSGESLIRNLLTGINQSKEYGIEDFIGYLPDAFGHTAGMVDILNSFGIQNALLWRGLGDKKSEFKWMSKSQKSITATHLSEGYFQDFLNIPDIKAFQELTEKIKENNLGEIILIPIGADHLGAHNNLPELLKEINSKSQDQIQSGSVFEYLKEPKTNLESHIGEFRDNSKNFILQGTYSTRNYLKRLNTLTSWELKKTETFATFCEKTTKLNSNKDFLDYAWKMILKNHAHDSICGCSVDSVHQEMETRFAKINQLLTAVKEKSIESHKKGDKIIVFNSSGFEYEGNIEIKTTQKLPKAKGFELIKKETLFPPNIIHNIHQIPVSEDLTTIYTYLAKVKNIKPLGYSQSTPTLGTDLKSDINTIENSFLKIELTKQGQLNITDKKSNKTYPNMLYFEDRADIGDTYNFSPIIGDRGLKAEFVKSRLLFDTPIRKTIEANYKISIPKNSDKKRSKKTITHNLKVQITLDADSPLLKFKIDFENKAQNHILQAKINLPEKITSTFSEDSIGAIERSFDPDYDLNSLKAAEFGKELPTNTAPMQRFVWAQNTAVITKGLHEYEINKKTLGITLVRAVGMLSGKQLHTRYNAAGPTISTPEAQCLRDLSCEFAITFTDKKEELFKLADYYFDPTIAFLSKMAPEYSININNPNISVLACKKAENSDKIVLRLLNITDSEQKTDLIGIEADSCENPIDKKPKTIVVEPYALQTVLIDPSF
ncbi:MAG: glycoside hydrolase family 38 C-terminal domain-containing protein [Candidatus Gastranaerophilales bacterium]|nr:glycoside hydrolase family 38 C-terminal domain-containing protein [Candidatus Gastranaerophilales bacterium]